MSSATYVSFRRPRSVRQDPAPDGLVFLWMIWWCLFSSSFRMILPTYRITFFGQNSYMLACSLSYHQQLICFVPLRKLTLTWIALLDKLNIKGLNLNNVYLCCVLQQRRDWGTCLCIAGCFLPMGKAICIESVHQVSSI